MNPDIPRGLDATTVAERQRAEGFNELGVDQRRTLLNIVGEVCREPMFLLLIGAGAIYLFMGDVHEALILLGFVGIIMGVTIVQERRTENALSALRDLSSPRALVIRDGAPLRIAGREVVRDDILILAEGDRVPADGVVLEAHELAADESLLTGESEAQSKFAAEAGSGAATEAAEGAGHLFAGTLIVRGQGLMRVSAIGERTELGRIGKSLQAIELESSPLKDEVGLLTRRLAFVAIGLCLLVAALFVWLRGGWLEGMLAGITLAMGILPQEFPVILIVFLALGARRIGTLGVLTRRLNCVETLGETTVLCVDKTGTLTQNRMAMAALSVGGQLLDVRGRSEPLPDEYHEILEYVLLASEIDPHDPMEQAFHHFAREFLANTEHLHPDWDLAREYELSPDLPAMSHLWQARAGSSDIVAAKGAPEAIADLCHLDAAARRQISEQAAQMAEQGLRVLGVAKAKRPAGDWPEIQHDFDFELLGLVGLADPLRPEVPAAVAECRRAGIRVLMITGDHPRTAAAIARAAGIDHGRVLSGAEFAALSPAERLEQMRSTCVFARVSPQQKLAIVEALKAAGEVVAMTGDGVNDAPALKAAHIGIAMGKRGTDVAREAASLVLLEDDFAAIVGAVRLGRRIFANLRQALIYTLAVHLPIIGLSILPLLFGLPLVLAPIHIAFLELVIDPACSVVFEAEGEDLALMQRPPRSRDERLVAARHIGLSLLQGALTTAVVAGLYWAALARGIATEEARAMAFLALVTANAVLIFASRSPRRGWHGMFTGLSPLAVWVLLGTLAAVTVITTVPPAAAAFGFAPPSVANWLMAAGAGAASLVLFIAAKVAVPAARR